MFLCRFYAVLFTFPPNFNFFGFASRVFPRHTLYRGVDNFSETRRAPGPPEFCAADASATFTSPTIMAGHGQAHVTEEEEIRHEIIARIEALSASMILDMVTGVFGRSVDMIQLSSANVVPGTASDALTLGSNSTRRCMGGRSSRPLALVMAVLGECHRLLINNETLSQRELYYRLIKEFGSQRELNDSVQDACATIGVPRHALNIGAATRGVIAGDIVVGPAGSASYVDLTMVGSTGWPIPGNLKAVRDTLFESNANFIIVIEKVRRPASAGKRKHCVACCCIGVGQTRY